MTMQYESTLSGADWLIYLAYLATGDIDNKMGLSEELLVQRYLGGDDNHLVRCTNRAYRGFNRTLHGFGRLPGKVAMRARAGEVLGQSFRDLQVGRERVVSQGDFDTWHRGLCSRLAGVFREGGFPSFAVGQGQKWINMTAKYVCTLGDERMPGFSHLYGLCHVPLDNILIEKLGHYGFSPLTSR